MRSKYCAVILLFCIAFPVTNLFAEEKNNDTAITIYNNDLALVRDARQMSVKSGLSEIRFSDVASRIDPTSVHFKSLTAPDKISVLEQNYEYDLVSADKILSKYADQNIQIFTKEGKMFDGKLLSSAGDIVLEKKDGGVQTISKVNVQNIDFPKLPLGLITRPTLVWMLSSHLGGKHDLEISYLTNGIGWHAEYVAVLDQEDKKMEISAWVSIDNQSGAAYENAKIKLIAGDVRRVMPQPYPIRRVMATMAMKGEAEDQFQEKTFFEYHLYSLNRRTTLKDNQIKQLSLFPKALAAVKKVYKYDGSQDPKKVKINVEFMNSKNEGMGMPLPAGKVRVYKEDADRSQEFVGEDQINHTPKDEKVWLDIGDAFDVSGERKQKETKNLGTRAKQETIEIKIRNHKENDIEVTAIEHFYGEWEITNSSRKYEKKDAHTAEFKVPVKKDSETIIEYTVITKW